MKETPATANAAAVPALKPTATLTATQTAAHAASQSSISGVDHFRADGAAKSAPKVIRCPLRVSLSAAVHCFKSRKAVLDEIGAPFREIVDAVGSHYRLQASDPLLNIEGTLTVCHAARIVGSEKPSCQGDQK